MLNVGIVVGSVSEAVSVAFNIGVLSVFELGTFEEGLLGGLEGGGFCFIFFGILFFLIIVVMSVFEEEEE